MAVLVLLLMVSVDGIVGLMVVLIAFLLYGASFSLELKYYFVLVTDIGGIATGVAIGGIKWMALMCW